MQTGYRKGSAALPHPIVILRVAREEEGVPIWYLGGLLVGFVIQVYIIFWFVANREHFA